MDEAVVMAEEITPPVYTEVKSDDKGELVDVKPELTATPEADKESNTLPTHKVSPVMVPNEGAANHQRAKSSVRVPASQRRDHVDPRNIWKQLDKDGKYRS